MIPQDFIQQLLGRLDIVEVVDRHVKLKKAGQNYSACCPFHSEKTPSFSVSPTKQFYHCFGCGAHGTAISFLMEYNGMGFREAVQELAEGVGMSMPEEANHEQSIEKARVSATLGEVMTAAMQFYRRQLKTSITAVDYLKGRGLTGEISAKFGLGYAPDDWQGLKGAVEDYTTSALRDCGLVIDSDEGRRYDRFRDRVMFPILDQRGNVIGFGGRVIGKGEPKYLNSPETPLFEKGRELYGLFHAKRAIRDENTVIVVEGYMDVVALAQSGVENAVATLGTATTPMHVEKLLRLADNLVFCFDGDKAGQRAAWRALEQALPVIQDGKEVRFLFLPAEDDPDTFVRQRGKEAFLTELKNAKPLSVFLLDELRSQVDPTSDEGKARLMTLAKPLIGQVTAPALALMLRRKLADEIGLSAIEIERVVPLSAQIGQVTNATRPGASYNNDRSSRSDAVDWGKSKFEKSSFRRKGPEAGAPAPRVKPPPSGPAVQAIARMLVKPVLANIFDLGVDDTDETALGAAFRVATFIRDHDGEGINHAVIMEHFRPTGDWIFVNQASLLLSEVDIDRLDLDTEFQETLERLRADAASVARRADVMRRARDLGLG
ncbi:MAG TPA: DNA primase [Betaproteobacteria bacterium]|jgi:DNA primase|nr:DNA primase [Betaproteobacteria bacterium]